MPGLPIFFLSDETFLKLSGLFYTCVSVLQELRLMAGFLHLYRKTDFGPVCTSFL